MQICLNDIWNKMIANKKKNIRTWFYIDEFYLLLKMPSSASYLQMVWKRARKWMGTPTVQHAFTNAADTVNAVFHNVPQAAKFFNTPYKKWLNLEIIDTENFNVIPYVESTISFHEFKKIDENGEIVPDENNVKNIYRIPAIYNI